GGGGAGGGACSARGGSGSAGRAGTGSASCPPPSLRPRRTPGSSRPASDRARLGARARRLRRRRAARRLERGVARAPGPPGARRPRSALVLVVAAPPDPGLVAPPGCAVEPLVHAPEA